MTHSEVIDSASKWVKHVFPLVFKEWVWAGREQPDIIGFNSCSTCMIEAKISRSDFLRDKKKSFRQDSSKAMGNYRFYACPEGLIKESEIPDNWGLLYINEKKKVKCIVNPYCPKNPQGGNIWSGGFKDKDMGSEYGIIYSIMRKSINKK